MLDRRVVVSLSLAVLAGCSSSARAPAPPPAPSSGDAPAERPGPPAPPTAPAEPPPPPPVVLEGQGASVVLPPGATVARGEEVHTAADGFDHASPVSRIDGVPGVTGTIEVSTGAELGWEPTTLAADLADPGKATHEKVAAVERPDGNWAAAYRLTSSCYVHAWSPAARAWCDASAPRLTGVPCEQVQAVFDVCLTLAPAGAADAPRLALADAFPNLVDPRALETLVAAGQAVAASDVPAFTALLAPGKIRLGRKKVDAAGLTRAIAKAGNLSRLMGTECLPDRGFTSCRWNSEEDGQDGTVSVYSRDGYGVIPTLELVRQRDGAWKVAGFGAIDLGSP